MGGKQISKISPADNAPLAREGSISNLMDESNPLCETSTMVRSRIVSIVTSAQVHHETAVQNFPMDSSSATAVIVECHQDKSWDASLKSNHASIRDAALPQAKLRVASKLNTRNLACS
jgi:hypothetical protein